MNTVERALQEDLDRLLDRLAGTTRAGALGASGDRRSELRTRLERSEYDLSVAREGVLRAYAAWRDALSQCEDLWAVVDLAADEVLAAEPRAA
jgi:hypothetical protein